MILIKLQYDLYYIKHRLLFDLNIAKNHYNGIVLQRAVARKWQRAISIVLKC
jgi:hypothetical protein